MSNNALNSTTSIFATPRDRAHRLPVDSALRDPSESIHVRNVIAGVLLVVLIFASWLLPLSHSTLRLARLILGMTGTLLMLSTELLYSYRKEGKIKRGSIRLWLRIHIVTGLAGPAMVLWHADWRFPGLSGSLSYLTLAVVISGIIGRYLYRMLPRTIKGRERSLAELKTEEKEITDKLHHLLGEGTGRCLLPPQAVSEKDKASGSILTIITATFNFYLRFYRWRRRLALSLTEKEAIKELTTVIKRHLILERRLMALGAAKKMLAKWTVFHKPLTLTMFTLIAMHVISIFYYGRVV